MGCEIFPLNALHPYKYVVVLSFMGERIILSRHKDRDTWETQGGHIEPGESPLDAARRELWEESGATEYDLAPLCDYRFPSRGPAAYSNGQVFVAHIRALGAMPESEMAEVQTFDGLPENLTYPAITPYLFGVLGVSPQTPPGE